MPIISRNFRRAQSTNININAEFCRLPSFMFYVIESLSRNFRREQKFMPIAEFYVLCRVNNLRARIPRNRGRRAKSLFFLHKYFVPEKI